MAFLHTVEFWPQSGQENARWLRGPDEDAFVRSSRAVAERYSEGVRAARIKAHRGRVCFYCFDHEPGRTEVEITAFTEPPDGYESARVQLPDGVAALSPRARALLALDILHAGALRLAEERGWAVATLEAARAHVVAHDLGFRWTGPAKSAPGRRHVARVVCTVGDDGFGHVVVEIRRAADGTLVAASPAALTGGSARAFRAVAASLRWQDSTTVAFTPMDHKIKVNVEDQPRLTVRAQGATPGKSVPRISVTGGNIGEPVPVKYLVALHAILDQLPKPPWLTWWATAPQDLLEISYDLNDDRGTRITARRGANKLKLGIERPASAIHGAADPIALAHADATTLLDTVRRRAALGRYPPLPTVAELATRIAR